MKHNQAHLWEMYIDQRQVSMEIWLIIYDNNDVPIFKISVETIQFEFTL